MVDPERLREAIGNWTLAFGDTAEVPLGHLLLDNPVARRPSVALSDGLYLWPSTSWVNHSGIAMLEEVFRGDEALRNAYEDRRAEYLEERVAQAFGETFPGARVLRNVEWDNPSDGKSYESDLLIEVDSVVLIVESKAGRLSPSYFRGKSRGLRRDIEDLLIAPARQARRLGELIEDSGEMLPLRERDGGPKELDCSEIHQVVTLTVTLEPIAATLPSLRDLVESGLADEDLETTTYSLSLFDLLTVLDILEHPSEVIHYLARRDELEKGRFLSGDEPDLLGFYLRTGFNLGEAEFDDTQLMTILGLSDPIDVHYYRKEAGLDSEKPRVRRSDWWTALLSTVERKARPRWTDVGQSLCNVAYEEQVEFERAVAELRGDIATGKRRDDDFVLFTNGPAQRRDYFIALIASSESSEARAKQLEGASRQAFSDVKEMRRVIALGLPSSEADVPYRVIALSERGE